MIEIFQPRGTGEEIQKRQSLLIHYLRACLRSG